MFATRGNWLSRADSDSGIFDSYRRHITSFAIPPTTRRPSGPSHDLKIAKLFPRILNCFHNPLLGMRVKRGYLRGERQEPSSPPHAWTTLCSLQDIFIPNGSPDSHNNLLREVEQVFPSPFYRWRS